MTSTRISPKCVGVIGAGSFGTAVANLLAHNADVLLYVRQQATFRATPWRLTLPLPLTWQR